jgi:Uma2 family endonuclease
MATVEAKTRYTPADLLAMSDEKNYELVDGQLVELSVGAFSSWVAGRLHFLISRFLEQNRIGLVWPEGTGCQCFPDSPDRVRKPDTLFISRGRLSDEKLTGYIPIAPDLVVEVVSPNDIVYELEEKIAEYLHAGVRLVWVVDPERRTVRIHRADGSIGWARESDSLDGEDVLPGFRCGVGEIFES